jgi:hypothetical protein
LEESGLRKNQIAEVRGFADKKLRVPERPLDYANRRVSILVAARGAASALYEVPRPQSGPSKPFGENGMPHRQGL